jgi:hypothetical protein
VKRNTDVEATIVGKYVVMAPLLDERARRLWAAAESVAIGYGGDALVSAATSPARRFGTGGENWRRAWIPTGGLGVRARAVPTLNRRKPA